MAERTINPVTDELAVLADMATSLRLIAGRKPLRLEGEFYIITEDDVETPKVET